MKQVDWQTALKLKGGQIRHALHSGGQMKSPTGTGKKLFANQLASFFPQMQLIMFKDVFNHQKHQNSQQRKEKGRAKTTTAKRKQTSLWCFSFRHCEFWCLWRLNTSFNIISCICGNYEASWLANNFVSIPIGDFIWPSEWRACLIWPPSISKLFVNQLPSFFP